ncbi:DNA-3-methyladenine glycosylase [Leucobacter salsicius]|uniref:DNA-3-methyladenine glycosylase n=1 Tax=Leucobacter salsicius TaxID=664638 RepID=UPI00034DB121|nr:DNA-3-methyladenine glycosylase [Leucobacter salsicius]
MDRAFFLPPALEVAPRLLGAQLTVESEAGSVTLRITEVEAYHGLGAPGPYDPGSHARRARTDRNGSMFGPPGHAYVYFSYGMHHAINMVCSPEDVASGVLIRSGEIIDGAVLAEARRHRKRRGTHDPDPDAPAISARMLARGPGNVAAALGLARETHDGLDLFAPPFRVDPRTASFDLTSIQSGPRVGVAGEAGGPAFPWRFWIAHEPTVSAFRPGRGAPRA